MELHLFKGVAKGRVASHYNRWGPFSAFFYIPPLSRSPFWVSPFLGAGAVQTYLPSNPVNTWLQLASLEECALHMPRLTSPALLRKSTVSEFTKLKSSFSPAGHLPTMKERQVFVYPTLWKFNTPGARPYFDTALEV